MTSPTTINMVTLEGFVHDTQNEPAPGAKVYIRLKPSPFDKGNITFLNTITVLITDDDGYFSVELPASKVAIVSIPSCNVQRSGLLPFTGTISLNQLGG